MFSSCRLLLMTGLLTACEVTSLELQSPGTPGGLYLRNIKLSGVEPGDYYLGSILDVTDVVPELSDSNNTLATPGQITLLPVAAGQ